MNFIKTVIDNKIKFSLKDQDSCPPHYMKFLEFIFFDKKNSNFKLNKTRIIKYFEEIL